MLGRPVVDGKKLFLRHEVLVLMDCSLLLERSALSSFHSIELQVVLTGPGHQMVSYIPVGRLIPLRDEPNEGDVIRKLQWFDRLVTGGAAVSC